MLLYLATFCVASVAAYSVVDENYIVMESDFEELRWADSYTVKATRVSLTSNLEEDYTAWKTNHSSRVDYNKGAVKVIMKIDEFELPSKFQIRPETTEKELNKIACHFVYEVLFTDDQELDEILPSLEDDLYKAIGNETVDETYATKFEYFDKDLEREVRKTLWAAYTECYGWIPVKFEVKKYNVVLGSLIRHDIWKFYDYDPEFSDENVFDTDQYGCEEKTAITADNDKITKELMFINPDNEKHLEHVFNHFKNKFNRKYAHQTEHALRKSIFDENIRMIASVNRRNLTYKLGVNQFTDRTPEEIKKSHGAFLRPEGRVGTVAFPYEESDLNDIVEKLPKNYDMRLLGLISPVKNQETCGSCWTFAAAAVTESGLARHNGGKVLSLSNQAIIDCAYDELGDAGAGGCDGGFDIAAYDFIMKHGLPTEEEYGSYSNQDGFCKIDNMTKTYPIVGYTDVTRYSFNAMKVAVVNNGPLFVYVDASHKFQAYSSGIFYETNEDCDPDRPNHAVTLVGYGESHGELYWILKNSWGESWGIDGYMMVAAKDNVCGVSAHTSYPVF